MTTVSESNIVPARSPFRFFPILGPLLASLRLSRGRRAARRGNWEESVHCYIACLRLTPENGRAWIQLGNALGQCDRPADALTAYTKAVAVEPALALAHYHLAMVLRGTARDDEAQAAFHSVLLLQPDNIEVREVLSADRDERTIEAALGLRALVLADAVRPSQHIGLAGAWRRAKARKAARRRDWRTAEKHYRMLAKSGVSDSRIYIQWGHALNEQMRHDEAVLAYRYAIAAGPLNPDAYLHLGLALRALGRNSAAHEAFAMVLRLAPHRLSTHPYLQETQALASLNSEDDDGILAPKTLKVPYGLTRDQRDIWMLMAAQISHRS